MAHMNGNQLFILPLAFQNLLPFKNVYAAEILTLSISTLHIIALFAVFSKSLLHGLMTGSLKGYWEGSPNTGTKSKKIAIILIIEKDNRRSSFANWDFR